MFRMPKIFYKKVILLFLPDGPPFKKRFRMFTKDDVAEYYNQTLYLIMNDWWESLRKGLSCIMVFATKNTQEFCRSIDKHQSSVDGGG